MGRNYRYVEVEVSLDEFDDDDLIEELESRNIARSKSESNFLIESIYNKRRDGKDYQEDLDKLIWETIGRI